MSLLVKSKYLFKYIRCSCEIANCLLEKGAVIKDNITLKNLIVKENDEISSSKD